IHGQVTTGFTRRIGANLIIVANDQVARDPIQKSVMKLGAPAGTKVEVLTLEETLQGVAGRKWPRANIRLLLRSPVDLVRLIEMGLTLKQVNVGGVNNEGATIKITNEVYATSEELAAWKQLDASGIEMVLQWEISSSPVNFNRIIRS